MTRKGYTMIGVAVGLVGFLGFALLPTLLYGGYAGVMLAGALLGMPVKATLLSRALIVLGMALSVIGVGALCAAAGAAAGAAVGALTGARSAIPAEAPSKVF